MHTVEHLLLIHSNLKPNNPSSAKRSWLTSATKTNDVAQGTDQVGSKTEFKQVDVDEHSATGKPWLIVSLMNLKN